MRVEFYRSVLFLGEIGEFYKEGLGELFFEFGREVVIFNSVLLEDLKTLAAAGDGERGKGRASSLKKVNDFDSASLCTFVNEGEAEIGFTLFENKIVLKRYTCKLCKLCRCESLFFAQVFYSACNFFQTVIHCFCLLFWI